MQTSRLAAIMFSDIVGYTALMGDNEKKAFLILNKNRQIHRNAILRHNGKWLKEMGDGILTSFNSAFEAVQCAIEIQKLSQNESDYDLRIGIHQGDVIFEGQDVFGDGVNIASRLQSLAEPGQIYFSESVFLNIHNKEEIKCLFIREEKLKNVIYPVKIYQVDLDKTYIANLDKLKPSLIEKIFTKKVFNSLWFKIILFSLIGIFLFIKAGNLINWNIIKSGEYADISLPGRSIAVLPLVDMSPSGDQEYLADGIAEAIINSLSKFEDLKVISRTSSFQFKNEKVDIRKIGQILGVNAILEGSVIRNNNKLRITVQLIDTEDGSHIWSETIDYAMTDIFTIMEIVATAVANKFEIDLSKHKYIVASKTSTDVYNLYLLGHYHSLKWTPQGWLTAIEHYQKALTIDPEFAMAYSGIAFAYLSLAGWHSNQGPSPENMYKATEAAKKALELDPDNAEAYIVLGKMASEFDWNWNIADSLYRLGFEKKPTATWAYTNYMNFLTWMGQFEESIALGKQLLIYDPISPASYIELMFSYLTAGKMKESFSVIMKAYELDSTSWLVRTGLAFYYETAGQYEKAGKYYGMTDTTKNIGNMSSNQIMMYGYFFGRSGKTGKAKECLNILMNKAQNEYVSSVNIATIYIGIKEYDKALDILENTFYHTPKDPLMIGLKTNRYYDPIRDNPRFIQLLEKLNFEDFRKYSINS